MKRFGRLLPPLALAILASSSAHAQHRDNYDASFDRTAVASPSGKLSLRAPHAAAARPALPVFVSATDPIRGVPTFLWAAKGAFVPPFASPRPVDAARSHLGRLAGLYDLPRTALAAAVVREIHDTGHGGVVVTLGQQIDGVEVFQEKTKLLMRRGSLELVAASGHLHGAAVASTKAAARRFPLPMDRAVAVALDNLYGLGIAKEALAERPRGTDGYRRFDLDPGAPLRFTRPSRVKKVYFPIADRLVPGYYLELFTKLPGQKASPDVHAYVIGAEDGRILYRANLKAHEAFQYRVWAETTGNQRPLDGPIEDWTPHPTGTPDGSYPSYIPPVLVSMEGFNTNPDKKADPWLAANATETRGNNVDAYTDDDDPDGFGPGDIRASLTGPLSFDRVFDTSLSPIANDEQRMASVAQLFYTTNWLHDYWYDSGFDEAAGNAQQNNFGRGGAGGDRLIAQAQDGALLGNLDNANMATPADGESPQMQMYLWSGPETRSFGVEPLNQSLESGSASFGPANFDVTGTLILADDGVAPKTNACEPIVNDVSGKIALIDRGSCSFQEKVQAAEAAGAIGVVIASHVGGPPPSMPGDDASSVTIPVLSVTLADGNALKVALASGPVTVHLTRVVAPAVDGSIDNPVVAHEWGHYLHHRLVDCALLQCGGESEGWGDFISLTLMLRPGDNLNGSYADTVYATVATPNAAYFGTRRAPYSVDHTKNAFTFTHITDDVPLPDTAPLNDWGGPNSEEHNTGEIWGAMLHEAYVALLHESEAQSPRYTFEEARRRMADYVVAGLKLAPREPTFTEQRDAILAAALAADPADALLIAGGFAKRGAGSCAASPEKDTNDNSGVVESFVVAPAPQITSITLVPSLQSCDSDGILDAEERGEVVVEIMNGSIVPLGATEIALSGSTTGMVFPNGQKATLPALDAFATTELRFEVALDRTITAPEPFFVDVTATNAEACTPETTRKAAFRVNYDNKEAASASDDFESDLQTWQRKGSDSTTIWAKTNDDTGNHVWHGVDFDSPSDTWLESPSLHVSATKQLSIKLHHRHSFETAPAEDDGPDVYWDGAVIEVSGDDGKTWQDVEKLGAKPGYGGTIGNLADNPLADRKGFVSTNLSWPSMDEVTLDLGTALAGKTARIRFRIGTDEAEGDFGWDIDDIAITGIDDTPFPTVVADQGTCGTMPLANAGEDQIVAIGDQVALDASKSSDPEGDPLSFTWTQLAGPEVTLVSATSARATFIAPEVKGKTTLTFRVSVTDGGATASDTVDVVVDPSRTQTLVAAGGCGCAIPEGSAGGSLVPMAAAALLVARRRRKR
ncbi:Chitinase [Minicystis rosea]|nr:Chitinase [Minicystis rosea]